MAIETAGATDASASTSTVDVVDPRAPRFGQSITTVGMVAFVATGNPAPLFAVAAVLVTSVLTNWRVDVYGLVWKNAVVPLLERPDQPEPASPHRFAKLLGAGFTATASLLWLVNLPLAATVVAAVVGALALVAAVFDLCVGCRMYSQVKFFRDLGVV
jgi:drug/metabolite transporter (DMT)-like permease